MLKMLFLGMLEASNAYYGDAIGLAPIALGFPKSPKDRPEQAFWSKECEIRPHRIACLNYDS